MWPAGQPAASLCSPLPTNPCSSVSGSKIFTFPPSDFALSVARRAPSLCSPLPANPCSSVPGSKIFTFPPSDFDLPGARRLFLFAPHSPRTLVAPFRGAKSSHFRRRISPSLSPGSSFSLLPTPRKPLQLRSGEQNLHIPAARLPPPRRSAAPSLCSPLPANPCSSVPGSKIFTFPPPDFSLTAVRRLYASKGATANPRKAKVNPLRLYFFCTSLKNGHFSPQNGRFGLFPCCMKFAKKFYSAILSIRKDALGALHTCAEHARLFRQALLSSNFVLYENI